uniref:Fibronectin type-III domain-containing protein n=1 Tax=viral metagenome TaxID=1070528 RepID=A0A6C0BPJ3_9ZZZZ
MSDLSEKILTTNTLNINTIQSNDDFTILCDNEIHLNTPNLLINNIRIDKYINNLLFAESNVDAYGVYQNTRTAGGLGNLDEITNCGTSSHTSVDATKISSYNTYIKQGHTYYENYVNLQSSNNLHIKVRNFISGYENGYLDNNIIYNDTLTSTSYNLKNYIYDLVNFSRGTTITPSHVVPLYTVQPNNKIHNIDYWDVHDFLKGQFVTKTIETSNLSTINLSTSKVDQIQPILTIESQSAINLVADTIMINGSNLDTIIKESLNEDNLFTISIFNTSSTSTSISYKINNFEVGHYEDTFSYDIQFDIFDDIDPSNSLGTHLIDNVRQGSVIESINTFINLTSGSKYNIIPTTVTNRFTGKSFSNITTSGGSGLFAVNTEVFVINIQVTVSEPGETDYPSISFQFDQGSIGNGFHIDEDFGHSYDIDFKIYQGDVISNDGNSHEVKNLDNFSSTPIDTFVFASLNPGNSFRINATITNINTNKLVSSNVQSDLYLPSTPEVTLGSWSFNDVARQYYMPVSTIGINKSINDYSIDTSLENNPDITDAVFDEFVNKKLYFTFNNEISSGNKTAYIKIIDSLGYTDDHEVSQNLAITYSYVNNTITLSSPKRLTYNTESLNSYIWFKNDIVIPSQNTRILQLSENENENATYSCDVVQSNDEGTGFSRTFTNNFEITLPTISPGSTFTIISMTSYTYSYTYNGDTFTDINPYANATISIEPSSIGPFNQIGTNTCKVKIIDQYQFENELTVGTFTVVAPTPISGISFTNVKPNTLTIGWSNTDTDGTPTESVTDILIYYGVENITDSNKDITTLTTNSTNITNLNENTNYHFKIIKSYFYYSTFESAIYQVNTPQKVLPKLNKIYIANNRIYWDIDLGTATVSNIQYKKYDQNRSFRTVNHKSKSRDYFVYNFFLNSSTSKKSVTIAQTKNSNSNSNSSQDISSICSKSPDADINRISLTIQFDSYHQPNITSGIFDVYRSDSDGWLNSEFYFEHFDFHCRTEDLFNNRGTTDNEKFAIIVHDGSHALSTVGNTTPVMSWKRDIYTYPHYNMEDLYSQDGVKSPNRGGYEISQLGIKNLVDGGPPKIKYEYVAIKNTSDFSGDTQKYGAANNTYFKISKTTIGIFLNKLRFTSSQHKDSLREQEFVDQNINSINGDMTSTSIKYTRIYVYRDRITSYYFKNLPLVTVWLDKDNGDIPWNDGVGNSIPPIAPDPPRATEIGSDYVILSWNPNPNNDGYVQKYKVNRIIDVHGVYDGYQYEIEETRETNGANNIFTWTGLTSGWTYYFTVTKSTNIGDYCSHPSPYFYCQSLTGDYNYAYNVDTAISDNDPEYVKLRKDYLSSGDTIQTYIRNSSTYFSEFSGTEFDEFYVNVPYYRNGILSVTTMANSGTPALPPYGLIGTASTTSISLSWSAGNNNDETFISYTVNREDTGGTVIASVQGITVTSYTWIDLNSSQQYYFTVQKVTNYGVTVKSNQLNIQTNDDYGTNPETPSVQSRNLKSVTFQWIPGNIGSGTLVSHNLVRYNDSGGTIMYSRYESTPNYWYEVIVWPEELEPDTNYYFRSEMVVNYNGTYNTRNSTSVFTFSYSKQLPSPAVLFWGGSFNKSSSSFDIGWRMGSIGDYTLEKVVIHWVTSGYYSSAEPQIWNKTLTLSTYDQWYGYSILSEKKEIYPAELETYATLSYGTLAYVYNFVFNNPDNVVSNDTYYIVVEKVYSDLDLNEYIYNEVSNIPVISMSGPYNTSSVPAKGISNIHATLVGGSPKSIQVAITLTGIDNTEVISSITFSKHPLSLTEYHGEPPWTEYIVSSGSTFSGTVFSEVFSSSSHTLVNGAQYNLGAIVVTNVDTYSKYTGAFNYNT